MAFRVILPTSSSGSARARAGREGRFVARLTEVLGFDHTRGSMWRYPAGAKGRRHKDTIQEETFVVLDEQR